MEELLREGLAAMGIDAPAEAIGLLCRYGELLLQKNEVMNLTAIRDEAGVARLHFLDSAALLTAADFKGKSVIDVGSGAGFPGVPLRILRPDIRLTTLDGVRKKTEFVREACDVLGLSDVETLWGRAEELPALRERFDVAVSRAVAELDMLAELCLPFVRVGGQFLAMKGPACAEEAARAERAIETLGGRVRELVRCPIPGTDIVHAVLVIDKTRPTPAKYPRRFAQIKKDPIR